ncbi:MAG: siroheme synthase CysG [Pseudomonadota bacterium]
MKAFPMFIKTTDRRVVIVGGGEQAAQKARLLLKSDAKLVFAAPALDDELRASVTAGRAEHHTGPIDVELFEGAAMVFVATGEEADDIAAHRIAKAAGSLVNVVDRPHLCDMTTPALVDRDPVVVAIGTEGTAPVLARQIKTKLEETLPQNLGGLAALAGRLRDAVAEHMPFPERRKFWRWVFAAAPRRMWEEGAEAQAAETIKAAITDGGAPDRDREGSIALVGAGPGARDLMTLRAVQRLQEADVIFYDRLVGEEALELARRDAERVYVGKRPGTKSWPQDRINALMVAEARKGHRVVRLKSGDPGIFGRAAEELAAARQAGIAVEIVPGVTAASAAGAALGRPLTDRSETSRLVLATATGQDGKFSAAGTDVAGPGSTTAFYMGLRQAAHIQTELLAGGVPAAAPVTVVVDASKAREKIFETRLDELGATVEGGKIDGSAVILVTWPHSAVAGAEPMVSPLLARA